jgi:hypothetical protein
MHLWFDTTRTDYSIKTKFDQIEKLLQSIRYPATNRLPRLLRHFKSWKANEFRITMLFGYKYIAHFFFKVFTQVAHLLLDSFKKS